MQEGTKDAVQRQEGRPGGLRPSADSQRGPGNEVQVHLFRRSATGALRELSGLPDRPNDQPHQYHRRPQRGSGLRGVCPRAASRGGCAGRLSPGAPVGHAVAGNRPPGLGAHRPGGCHCSPRRALRLQEHGPSAGGSGEPHLDRPVRHRRRQSPRSSGWTASATPPRPTWPTLSSAAGASASASATCTTTTTRPSTATACPLGPG